MSTSVTDKAPEVDVSGCWDNCIQGAADRFKCEDMTTERVAQVAGTILAILSLLIFVSALMVQYPTAANTFFAIYGLGAIASVITLIVAGMKYCKEHDIQSTDLSSLTTSATEAVATVTTAVQSVTGEPSAKTDA